MLGRLSPYWWVCLGVFLLHQLVQKGFGIDIPVVHEYIDPLLAMPILLGALLVEREMFFGRPRLTVVEVVLYTIILACIFEYLFPRWSRAFYYDPIDFIFYGLGAVIFYFLINPSKRTAERQSNARRLES